MTNGISNLEPFSSMSPLPGENNYVQRASLLAKARLFQPA